MAFIDSVNIHATSGKGGDGIVRWLRDRGNPRGGPAGGNGGRGGDISIVGVRDLAALSAYRRVKTFKAARGGDGGSNNCTGSDGESVELKVPVGTIARVPELSREFEVTKEGEKYTLFYGGAGGFGNAHFKRSSNQNPFQITQGKVGEEGNIEFELKLIADAGLIGLPNAGKSSLLNALTRARARVGDYPFTTLEPSLGVFFGYVLADIPGLIEGASQGKGLGTRFLRHIERTKILVHLISAEQDNPVESYQKIRRELETFGRGLSEKTEIVVISKSDTREVAYLADIVKDIEHVSGGTVLLVSIKEEQRLKEFSDTLAKLLAKCDA